MQFTEHRLQGDKRSYRLVLCQPFVEQSSLVSLRTRCGRVHPVLGGVSLPNCWLHKHALYLWCWVLVVRADSACGDISGDIDNLCGGTCRADKALGDGHCWLSTGLLDARRSSLSYLDIRLTMVHYVVQGDSVAEC